jgi:ABC-type methionine transport system ATPase subunit
VIETRGVVKRFGDFTALDGVSVDVPAGSLTALLGPSGSGKSTLLRVIAGLERADEGVVCLEGQDVTNVPPQERGVGFVFQHYAAFKHMTVWENVAFGLKIRRRPRAEVKQRVSELLELVQLARLGDRYPAQLSGGQRQRMGLARALAVDPKVLLLDEPFAGLSIDARRDVQSLLASIPRDVTIEMIQHDMDVALEFAERITVPHFGEVVVQGSRAEPGITSASTPDRSIRRNAASPTAPTGCPRAAESARIAQPNRRRLGMRALFVTVRMKPEYRDQILKGALEDGRGSREDEPGCLRFDVFQDDSDPNTIYFYEVYRDDAALAAHRAAPHYPAWGNLPAEWFVDQKAVVIRGTMIAPSEAQYR